MGRFSGGRSVTYGTEGSTRPDYSSCDSCVEVKNYDLTKGGSRLVSNVVNQARNRAQNLPEGMAQDVVVDIRGQNVPRELKSQIERQIIERTGGLVRSVIFKSR